MLYLGLASCASSVCLCITFMVYACLPKVRTKLNTHIYFGNWKSTKMYVCFLVILVAKSSWKNCNVPCFESLNCLHGFSHCSAYKYILELYGLYTIFFLVICILLAKCFVLWYMVDIRVSFAAVSIIISIYTHGVIGWLWTIERAVCIRMTESFLQ